VKAAANNATYAANITLGAHTATTGADKILVGVAGTSATVASTIITGAVAGDMLKFVDTATTTTALSAAQQTAVGAMGTLALALAYVDSATVGGAAKSVTSFQWSGNTYVMETVLGGAADAGTFVGTNSLVELVGLHTITAAPVAGVVTLAT